MKQLAPPFDAKIAAEPHKLYNVIVRVTGDLEWGAEQLRTAGFEIRRRFTLIRGFAATATGTAIQAVLDREWIDSIEEDQEVTALGST